MIAIGDRENAVKEISWGGKENVEAVYKGNSLIWPPVFLEDRYVQFNFDQTADPNEAFTNFIDNDFISYVTANVHTYMGKSMEDGTVAVIPLVVERDLERGFVNLVMDKYGGSDGHAFYNVTGQPKSVYNYTAKVDYLTQIPTLYFSCKEVEEDKFNVVIATYPFVGAHEVFGKDRLIGRQSGMNIDDKWYSNIGVPRNNTFTQVKQFIANKGSGWYGMHTEEMGVLMMIDMCLNGVNGNAITYDYAPFGVANVFVNGGDGRIWPPNLEIDPATNVAKVTHLDGNVEYFDVPYIWGGYFDKMYWGEYLTMLPKSTGPMNKFYKESQSWIGNSKGTGIYMSSKQGSWSIAGDRDDSDATGINLRCRACYHGKYTVTHDPEYFESLPII